MDEDDIDMGAMVRYGEFLIESPAEEEEKPPIVVIVHRHFRFTLKKTAFEEDSEVKWYIIKLQHEAPAGQVTSSGTWYPVSLVGRDTPAKLNWVPMIQAADEAVKQGFYSTE